MALAYYGLFRPQSIGFVESREAVTEGRTMANVDHWIATGKCANDLTGSELAGVMLDQRQDWVYRAWAALLAPKHGEQTKKALSRVSACDPVFWVRREALRSLKLLADTRQEEVRTPVKQSPSFAA
jgi:hypothetical protein